MNQIQKFIFQHRYLLLIALLSLALKVAFLLQGAIVNPDAATYIAAAEKHSQGLFKEGLSYYRMPLYPLFLAGIHILVPDWIGAGRVLSFFPLWLSLFPLYEIIKRLFNNSSALWGTFLFAVLPTFNEPSVDVKRDPLFLLFFLCSLWLLVIYFQKREVKWFIGFMFSAVFAATTRVEGILLFLLLPVPLYLFLTKSHFRQPRNAMAMVSIALALAIVGLGMNFFEMSNHLRLNEVTRWLDDLINLKFFAGYQRLMMAIKELQYSLPMADLRNNLLELTRHYAPLIYCLGLLETLLRAVFPTSILAFWAFRWRTSDDRLLSKGRWLIFLVWSLFTLLNILYLLKRNFIQERYFWVPIVLTLPWIGYGISLWWQERLQRKFIAILVVTIMLFSPLVKTISIVMEPQDRTIVEAGNWLRQFDPKREKRVIYNDRRLPLYADRVSEVTRVVNFKAIKNPDLVERSAVGAHLVALYLSQKSQATFEIFEHYQVYKVFEGKRKKVVFLKRLSNEVS